MSKAPLFPVGKFRVKPSQNRPWGFGCPHCGELEDLSWVYTNVVEQEVTFDKQGGVVLGNYLSEEKQSEIGFECYTCGQRFDKPRRFYGDHVIAWEARRETIWMCPVNGCGVTRVRSFLCNGTNEHGHPPGDAMPLKRKGKTAAYTWQEFLDALSEMGLSLGELRRLVLDGRELHVERIAEDPQSGPLAEREEG